MAPRLVLVLAGLGLVSGAAPLAAVFSQQAAKVGGPWYDSYFAPGLFNGRPATSFDSSLGGRQNGCGVLAAFVGETCPMCYKPQADGNKFYGNSSSSLRRTPGHTITFPAPVGDMCVWCTMRGISSVTEYGNIARGTGNKLENSWVGGASSSTALTVFYPGKCPCDGLRQEGKTCFNFYSDAGNTIGQNSAQISVALRGAFSLKAIWPLNTDLCETVTAELPIPSPFTWAYTFSRDPTKTSVRQASLADGSARCVAVPCSDRTAVCQGASDFASCCAAKDKSRSTPAAALNPLLAFPNGCKASGNVCVPSCSDAADWRSLYPAVTTPFRFSDTLAYFVDPTIWKVPTDTVYTPYAVTNQNVPQFIINNNKQWACQFAPFFRERGCMPTADGCSAGYQSGDAVVFGTAPSDDQYVA